MKKLFIFAAFILFFSSCSSDDEMRNNPYLADLNFVLQIDLNLPQYNNLNFPAYADLRDNARSFSDIATYADWAPFNLAAPGQEPARVAGAVVSGGYFELFGVAPLLGRTLLPSDDRERATSAR